MKNSKTKNIRLFIDGTKQQIAHFAPDVKLEVKDQDFIYLTRVMRLKIGDEILVFNGIDGEFLAEVSEIHKKFLIVEIIKKTAELSIASNITLAFTLVKNVKNEFIATKATELGIAKLQPLVTQYGIVDKVNEERLFSATKEASEQCERSDLVKISKLQKLSDYLKSQNHEDKLFILCDETLASSNVRASKILSEIQNKNLHKDKEIVIFIGPEGGFSNDEFAKFRELKNLYSISLGSTILRADTAIISALVLVKEFLG